MMACTCGRRYPSKSDEAAGRLAARKPSTWTVDWTVEVWVALDFCLTIEQAVPRTGPPSTEARRHTDPIGNWFSVTGSARKF